MNVLGSDRVEQARAARLERERAAAGTRVAAAAAQQGADPDLAEMLAFERTHGARPQKWDLIRERFGISEVRYTILLGRALRDGSAAEVDPVLARHLSERAQRARSGRVPLFQ